MPWDVVIQIRAQPIPEPLEIGVERLRARERVVEEVSKLPGHGRISMDWVHNDVRHTTIEFYQNGVPLDMSSDEAQSLRGKVAAAVARGLGQGPLASP